MSTQQLIQIFWLGIQLADLKILKWDQYPFQDKTLYISQYSCHIIWLSRDPYSAAKIPSVPKNSGLSRIQLCCPEVPIFEILSRISKISLICPEPLYRFSYTVHHHISALRKTKTSVLFVAFLAEYHQYLVTGHI